jgi:hypothetical protein
MRVIGIDPGLAGGFGVLDLVGETPAHVELHRTPVLEVQRHGRRRREYDVRAMVSQLRFLCQEARSEGARVEIALEAQGPRPVIGRGNGQHKGGVSAYHTGVGFGLWLMAVVSGDVPYYVVQPAVWKRHHGLLGADKRASRLRAQERFPQLGVIPARAEGPAEGLLLAAYVAWRWRPEREEADAGAAAGR